MSTETLATATATAEIAAVAAAPATKKAAAKKTKPAAKKAAPVARKTTGTRKQSERVRPPAAELMAKRNRMFFGAAYMNGVLAGFHRDHAKMLQHAIHLKVDQPAKLKALSLEKLREKLATAILARPDGATPFSIHLVD